MIANATTRACFHTLGCRLNQSETQSIQERFESEGYHIVPFGGEADLLVINTCTVTRLAESKCRQSIRQFQRRNPHAYVAVVGCYSQTGYKELSQMKGIDLILGNHDKINVIDYIGDAEKAEQPVIVRERIDKQDFTMQIVGERPFQKRANLKIQEGCDFFCSFCIIPFARGRARSREWDNLMAEARNLAQRGVRELVLTGVNIGTYDSGGKGIVDIVDALNEIDGIERVRISSIEPTTIPETLFDRMNEFDHTLTPFLHIPLQSGSDKILKEMKRKYDTREFLEFIEMAKERVPNLMIGTDILVGYPGETEEDFEHTCQFFLDSPINFCHVFTYSERQNTPAAKSPEQIPTQERKRRSARLRRLSAHKKHETYAAYEGRIMNVLFEDPREDTWPGYTDNYIRVVTSSDQNLTNQFAPARLRNTTAEFVEADLV